MIYPVSEWGHPMNAPFQYDIPSVHSISCKTCIYHLGSGGRYCTVARHHYCSLYQSLGKTVWSDHRGCNFHARDHAMHGLYEEWIILDADDFNREVETGNGDVTVSLFVYNRYMPCSGRRIQMKWFSKCCRHGIQTRASWQFCTISI